MPLVQLQSACVAFGHVALLDKVELVVEDRERLCLIGRNGSGKSTLLNVIAGAITLDSGSCWRQDGLSVAQLAQSVPDAQSASLFDVVAAGLGDHGELLRKYHAVSLALADGTDSTMAQFSELQAQIEAAGAWEGSQRIDAMLSRLNLPGEALLADCSGGVRRRAMLGQAMVSEPDLLLLDEPTNHLDIEAIDALEEAIARFPGAVLFITHDRSLMDNLATRIIELDRGQLQSFPGSYSQYRERKAALLEAEADQDRKFDQHLAQEEVWIRQGIKARRTRNEGRVRRLEALRSERAQRRNVSGNVSMRLESGESSGKKVIEAQDVGFSYGETPIIAPFSTLILRGDRIGLIGRNGSGKTTLLRLLLGQLQPGSGSVEHGTRLQIAYFDQERAQLDPEQTVRNSVADGADQIQIGGQTRHVISYLQDFLFAPARANSPVKTLSGGERNRLLLARLFVKPSNLLVLDEPTNDLDIETLELLEALLADYDGTLILVSHDRSFLDRTVTSTLSIDAGGNVLELVGGYSEWQQWTTARASAATDVSLPARAGPRNSNDKKAKPRKPGFKEQRELAALPARIEALEDTLAALQESVSDPKYYEQAQAVVDAGLQSLADTQAELESAYERWQALEALADDSKSP